MSETPRFTIGTPDDEKILAYHHGIAECQRELRALQSLTEGYNPDRTVAKARAQCAEIHRNATSLLATIQAEEGANGDYAAANERLHGCLTQLEKAREIARANISRAA